MTQHHDPAAARVLVDAHLSLEDAIQVVDGRLHLSLLDTAWSRCAAAHGRLQEVIAEERHVYGITTGFGPLANRLVSSADGAKLQQNLVHHLATGVGPAFDWATARAIVLARLMSILQGVSGASKPAIDTLLQTLNGPLAPVMPCRGTVGASGDLTPLAHMVLCFQGRGAFCLRDGRRISGTQGLEMMGLEPVDLDARDGLALVNGTSAMTGVGLINTRRAAQAIDWAITLTAAMAEAQGGRIEAWHPAFGVLRPHPRQAATASLLRARVAGSTRVERSHLADRRLAGLEPTTEESIGQDAYTLRCAPQVIGAVWDTADWHSKIVATELCAATDNPIFPIVEVEVPDSDIPDSPLVLHGGNFMGQHVGLASDALAQAVTVLAGLAERQIARLTDERLNRGLPAFLHRGPAGLNSGLMGAQVTATALLAEMRTIGPASIHSISTNGANQDVVSMGTIAARLLGQKLGLLTQIHAILALCVAQSFDIIEEAEADTDEEDYGLSANARTLHQLVRSKSAAVTEDRPLGRDIETLAATMARYAPPKLRV
ncbi:HAL/PAL/TAL family ammonia-lyase [Sulfitobacter sp. JB4-11]|uniref:HAL/PAL/TAL family ammonia-lyase n=1 Tax=Sulfitobacter rhodophyticola TaxID=3238304 RepID=UPI0035112622